MGFEREIISVCETVVGPYTLEAVVRCNKTPSSLSWQSAVLAYAKPGRNWPTVWIKMFHLLRTLRDHTYFAGLYYCYFCCRIRKRRNNFNFGGVKGGKLGET